MVNPHSYLYRFSDPISGAPVLRQSPAEWNGQRPQGYMMMFTGEQVEATLAERDAVIAEMRDILLAVKAETMGEPVGGGDGGTYVVRPISGATYNRIVAALGERRT